MDTRKLRRSRGYHAIVAVGLVCYGIVHLVLAWIAAELALGQRKDASPEGAMEQLAGNPLGLGLLWVMALGLFSLVIWQGTEAIIGPHQQGPDLSLRRRLVSAGRAIVYLVLGGLAVRVAIGGGSHSGKGEETASASLMHVPAGPFLVGAVGTVVLAVGIGQITKGLRRKFTEDLKRSTSTFIKALGAVGYVAKGIALAIIGGLFGLAAVTYDPKKAGGMDDALNFIRSLPLGPAMLLAIAAGIGCFGVYCFFWTRHAEY
jgi:hypothetical protein